MKVLKESDKDRFDNSQMLTHFWKIYNEIILYPDDTMSIELYGNVRKVDSEIIKCVITYYKLKKKYRLESETLLDVIITRMGIDYSHIDKGYLKDFFNEIYKNIKLLKENNKMKRKIVWLKKDNIM